MSPYASPQAFLYSLHPCLHTLAPLSASVLLCCLHFCLPASSPFTVEAHTWLPSMDSGASLALAIDRFYMLLLTRHLSTIFTHVRKRERQTDVVWQAENLSPCHPNTWRQDVGFHGLSPCQLQGLTEPTHQEGSNTLSFGSAPQNITALYSNCWSAVILMGQGS